MTTAPHFVSLLGRLIMLAVPLALTASALAWSGPFNLTSDFSPTFDDFGPSLDQDSQGYWHLTWTGKTDGKWRLFHRMRDPSGVWRNVTEVKVGDSENPFSGRCHVGPDDMLHIVWSVGGNGGYGIGGVESFYRNRSAAGVWSPIVNISNTYDVPSFDPDVVASSTGQVFIAWHEAFDWWEIAFRYWDGASWQPPLTQAPQRLTVDSPIDHGVAMAMDSTDTLHIVWSTYDELFYSSRSSAGVWSPRVNLSNNAGNSQGAEIALDQHDNVHVTWDDTSSGDWEIYYATNMGGSWSAPYNVSQNPTEIDCCGSLAVGDDGSINVTWIDYVRQYFRRDGSSGWGTRLTLFDGGSWGAVGRGNALLVDPAFDVNLLFETGGDLWSFAHAYPDVTGPGPVSSFMAEGFNTEVQINPWWNPSDLDFVGTMVRFSTTAPPATTSDGTLLYQQPGPRNWWDVGVDHTGLTNGVTYYYTAFAYDDDGNFSVGVSAQATPAVAPDFDKDGDVDSVDFGFLQNCLSGSSIPFETGCDEANLDGDTDVDEADTTKFMNCYNGPGIVPIPTCAN